MFAGVGELFKRFIYLSHLFFILFKVQPPLPLPSDKNMLKKSQNIFPGSSWGYV